MAPKRSRADDATVRRSRANDATAQELKKTKSAVDEAFAELVCPITHNLPIDPVMAEDGKVYERKAIAEWLQRHARSPLTNEAMGTKLLPATQVKNMIRGMIKSGALTGEKTDEWRKKLEEEEDVEEMRRRAEAGDGKAMAWLAKWTPWDLMFSHAHWADQVTSCNKRWYSLSPTGQLPSARCSHVRRAA